MSALDMRDRDTTTVSLPKPSWTDRLPTQELTRIEQATRPKGFTPALYGIEFTGKYVDGLDVAQIAVALAEASESLSTGRGAVGFFRYGSEKRQVILPLRRPEVPTGDAREILNHIVRLCAVRLELLGLPAIELPQNLDPFAENQHWRQ